MDAIRREENILYAISSIYVFPTHFILITRIKEFVDKLCNIKERTKRGVGITDFRKMLICIILDDESLYDLFSGYTLDFMWEPIMHYLWGGYQLREEETEIKISIARALNCSKFRKKGE